MTLRPLRIFLCHSSADKSAVKDLYRRLKGDGHYPWLDEEDLLPGQDWQYEIPLAVRASDIVLVCLSRNAVSKRGYVQKEILFALDVADEQPEGTIFVIPLRLEECDVPLRLGRWQWVNLYDENGYERLLRGLRLGRIDPTVRAKPVAESVRDTGMNTGPAADAPALSPHTITAMSSRAGRGSQHPMEGPSPASWFLVAIAWTLVGIPLGWGIYITLAKVLVLFR